MEKGETLWEINVKYAPKTETVKIGKTKKGMILRGDHTCERCSGNGKYQACYPSGSGKNIQGDACPTCDGTGKCSYCKGAGSY